MSGKLSVLRLLHLYPGVGVALFGDTYAGGQLGGAIAAFQSNASNPAAGFGAAATEFMNDLAIAYTGYKPTDGSQWFQRGYPFRTYGFHAAIELTHYLVKRFIHKSFKLGPFKFP